MKGHLLSDTSEKGAPFSLEACLENEALRQCEFPVTRHSVFLAHAGVCPLPDRVQQAVQSYLLDCTRMDQEDAVPKGLLGRTRQAAARLLGVSAGEIALVGPTSLGLSQVAAGLDWKPGDEVLVYFDDYPSNVYPWMALESRGVRVRYLTVQEPGRIELETVQQQVTSATRLVALASCHFLTGWRLDVTGIGTWLRERGVLFCLDGIQTLGAFHTPAESVDFLAADAHKWLLGPAGAGILYVRKAVQEQLRPIAFGWSNVACPEFVTQPELQLRPDARRYEAGTAFLLGVAGLQAALELIESIGLDTISRRLVQHRRHLVDGLTDLGWEILNPRPPLENTGPMLSVVGDPEPLIRRMTMLRDDGVVASLRTLGDGRRCLRFSPHVYNTTQELDHALKCMKD